jgi:hypothetical protein
MTVQNLLHLSLPSGFNLRNLIIELRFQSCHLFRDLLRPIIIFSRIDLCLFLFQLLLKLASEGVKRLLMILLDIFD